MKIEIGFEYRRLGYLLKENHVNIMITELHARVTSMDNVCGHNLSDLLVLQVSESWAEAHPCHPESPYSKMLTMY
jgi:hypothetical protein